jgi:hypothetical protein
MYVPVSVDLSFILTHSNCLYSVVYMYAISLVLFVINLNIAQLLFAYYNPITYTLLIYCQSHTGIVA